MIIRSKKVLRQIQKSFDGEISDTSIQRFGDFFKSLPDSGEKSELQSFFSGFPHFLEMVDEAYEQMTSQVDLAKRSLEISSRELMEVNKSLSTINQTFDAMVNSLGQGFFLFGPDGKVDSLCSKICEVLLEGSPAGKFVADVLKVSEEKRGTCSDWISMMFQEVIDFEDLASIGQKFFPHSGGHIVSLEYKPVRDKQGKIQAIVVIATDRTREIEADRKAEGLQAYATLVVAILKDRTRFSHYVIHSRRFFQEMRELLAMEVFSPDALTLIRRHLHTLKGAAGTFGMIKVKDHLHQIETDLSSHKNLKEAQKFLRKATPECENIFENLLDEHRDIIGDTIRENKAIREINLDSLSRFAGRLKGPDTSLEHAYHSFVSDILCVPVHDVLKQFHSLVQQTAKSLRKKVSDLQISGENLRIFPERYGDVWENLEHLFRNLVDHGIETDEVRRKLGKPELGQVVIACRLLPGTVRPMIEIKISDDGKGIDPEVVRAKMIKNGLAQAAHMSDSELVNQVFEQGFSTAQRITETSGRGIGLDALKNAILEIGGQISVESVKGQGTTFVMIMPLMTEPLYEVLNIAS